MASFDSFLNAVIPWVIAFFGIFILYRPLKEPIDLLFGAIGRFIKATKEIITGENRGDDLIEDIATLEYE